MNDFFGGEPQPVGELFAGKFQVRIAGEMAGDLLMRVDDDMGLALRHHRQRQVVAGHQAVAAEHQVSAAGIQLYRADILRRRREPQMAGHRAALLRHAELVDRGVMVALEMLSHLSDRLPMLRTPTVVDRAPLLAEPRP